MSGFLKGGKFGKPMTTETTTGTTPATPKATPFGKKKLGGLKPKVEEPNEVVIEEKEKEEAPVAAKPKLGAKKKLGGLKATPPAPTKEEEDEIARQEDLIAEAALCGDNVANAEIEEPNEISIEEESKEEEEPVEKETKVEEKPKKKSRTKVAAKETAESFTLSDFFFEISLSGTIELMFALRVSVNPSLFH